jgi:3-oxo-5-alpha-steroid 4-dehydrogenase 1
MDDIYRIFLFLIFGFAIIVFILLFYISAPYGKFLRSGWGPVVSSKWAWMIMELPSPALIILFFITSGNRNSVTLVFLIMWLLHYLDRTFIYSFSQSGRDKPYPIMLVGMAFVFNCMNGFVNGFGVFHFSDYGSSWLVSWQFITGIIIFMTGFIINKTADEKLRVMRKGNPQEYIEPKGWLFEYISCPHYFGEIIEWLGWAVMTWSLPGFAFFIFTFANLFPRGLGSHSWYKEKFDNYPVKRKAIIPFVI